MIYIVIVWFMTFYRCFWDSILPHIHAHTCSHTLTLNPHSYPPPHTHIIIWLHVVVAHFCTFAHEGTYR